MLILDASVLLSPYLCAIASRVDPPNFGVAYTFDWTISKERPPFQIFRNLVAFCQVGENEEELQRLRERTTQEVQKLKYEVVTRPGDRNGNEVYRRLWEHLGPYESGESAILGDLFAEQIWGALHHDGPILALGSPVPRIWEKLETKFSSQVAREDLGPLIAGPIVEFKNLRIDLVVFADLNCWLIDVLAPSTTEIGYLGPEQFMKLLKFVARFFDNSSPTEQSSKSPE